MGAITDPEQLVTHKLTPLGKIEEHYLLDKEQIAGLKPQQKALIASINPDLYCHFDKQWQIAALSPSQLGKIDPKYARFLTEEQIKNIDPSLLTGDLLPYFTPHQIAKIPCEMIESIAPVVGDKIGREMIVGITSEELIPRLEDIAAIFKQGAIERGRWTSWIAPTMVPFICEKQVPYLKTKEQIALCPPLFLRLLTSDQFALVGAEKEKDRIVKFFEGKKLDTLAGELCWIDSYLAEREKEWPSKTPFFKAITPYGYRLETLKGELRKAFLDKGRVFKKELSIKRHINKVLLCIESCWDKQLALQVPDQEQFVKANIPLADDLTETFKNEKRKILGDSRFRLTDLATRLFSPADLGIVNLNVAEGVSKWNWEEIKGMSALGGLTGGAVGSVFAIELAALGPIGWGIGAGVVGYAALGAAVSSFDDYNYSDHFESFSSAIRGSLGSLSMRSIGPIQQPSDLPRWPYKQSWSTLQVEIACDLSSNWGANVWHTMKGSSRKEIYAVVLAKRNLPSRPLMACRHETIFRTDGSVEMKLEEDPNSLLRAREIKEIPTASANNSNSQSMCLLYDDYLKLLLAKVDVGNQLREENRLSTLLENSEIVRDRLGVLPPLLLPKNLIENCDKFFLKKFTMEACGPITGVERVFSFKRLGVDWTFKIHYEKEHKVLAEVSIGNVDAMTMESYRSHRQEKDRIEHGDYQVGEFLIQALYGESLIGNESRKIGEIVAPKEVAVNQMLYTTFEANCEKCWTFNCQEFSGEHRFVGNLELLTPGNHFEEMKRNWSEKISNYQKLVGNYKKSVDDLDKLLQLTTTLDEGERSNFVSNKLCLPESELLERPFTKSWGEEKTAPALKELKGRRSCLIKRLKLLLHP